MKALNCFVLATATVFSLPAFADRSERIIDHLDSDADRRVSLVEFTEREGGPGQHMFTRIDSNGDGAIDSDEAAAARAAREARAAEKMAERSAKLEQAFSDMDGDGDGMVTQMEMRVHAFNRMDVNQDGYLDSSEIKPPRHHRGRQHP